MAERETLEVDILIVGGGPAGLSAALRLAQLQKEKGGEPLAIAVLEKAREAGAHMLSGAVLDPSTLKDLVPDFKAKGAPLAAEVQRDDIYFLTRTAKLRLPITPPFFRNHGNYIISLNKFVKWLAGLVEAEGIDIFTGFAATEVLFDGDAVAGVRTGDRGIDKHGQKKSTFEPGVDIRARVTIFTDGVRGNLTKALVRRLGLDDGKSPAVYAIGLKELWEVPAGRVEPGRVVHTMGYPLKMEEFGGGFMYSMPGNLVSLGLVAGLDYKDPMFDPHVAFQHLKRHPLVASVLEGGTLDPLRRQGVARRRLVHDSEDLCGRRAHRRGCRRVHELGAPQGHPSRHAHRHARRGHGLRGGPQGGHVRGGDEGLRRSRAGECRAQGTLPGA